MSGIPPQKPLLSRNREEWQQARDARRQLLAKVRARRAIALKKRQATQHNEKSEHS